MSDYRILDILETFIIYHLSLLAITTIKSQKITFNSPNFIFIISSFAHNAVNVFTI